jgi:tetraacyldisaccharide 4'-kinase
MWPVSLLALFGVRLRQGLYMSGLLRTYRLPVPVVVVGNVVAGGSGKTPLVLAIVQHLQRQGWQPGVAAWPRTVSKFRLTAQRATWGMNRS